VTSVAQTEPGRRCAVVFNPTKISDQFRVLMEENLQRRGWTGTLWLETSAEDPLYRSSLWSFPQPFFVTS
jgi:hypothetical protein